MIPADIRQRLVEVLEADDTDAVGVLELRRRTEAMDRAVLDACVATRRPAAARWLLCAGAALVVGGCSGAEDSPEPPRAVARATPPPTARSLPACALDGVPADAPLASRDLVRGPGGPWIAGQSVFEYVVAAPRSETGRHLNTNDVGGTSSVGADGAALTFALPANHRLPAESLLRFGPPPTLAFRAVETARHRVAVVACATDKPPPRLELEVLRRADGAEPVAEVPVTTLMYGNATVRPGVELLESAPASALVVRFERAIDVELRRGDVVRLVAIGVIPGEGPIPGTLEVAFDLAVWVPKDGSPPPPSPTK